MKLIAALAEVVKALERIRDDEPFSLGARTPAETVMLYDKWAEKAIAALRAADPLERDGELVLLVGNLIALDRSWTKSHPGPYSKTAPDVLRALDPLLRGGGR